MIKKIILKIARYFLSSCLKIKITLKSKYLLSENRKKILLINLHGIGDLVMCTPAIELLRENYPSAQIDMLLSEPAAVLFENDPRINNLFKFNNKKSFNSIKNVKQKYDTVLLFIGGIWGSITALSVKSKEIIGMALNTTLAAVLKDKNNKVIVRRFDKNTHLSDLMTNVASLIVKNNNAENLVRDDRENHEYKLYINFDNINVEKFNIKKPYIVLAPETNWDIKNIKQQLIDDLGAYYKASDFSVIIIGSKNNSIDNKNDLRGKTTIPEAIKIIRGSEYVISADSAFMHIASAVEIPCISVFGPTSPERLSPKGPGKCRVIKKDICCSPCYKEIYIPKCINPEYNLCMKWSLDDIKKELDLFDRNK